MLMWESENGYTAIQKKHQLFKKKVIVNPVG